MQNRLKTLVFGLASAGGLLLAAPAVAQTFNQSYYYPQFTQSQYSQPSYGYGCPALSYNLTLGSSDYYTGGQVSQLQNFLRNRYSDPRLTGGYYGSLTAYYVTRFQQEQGVYPATGGVGPLTRAAIQRVCGGSYPYPTPHPNPYPTPVPTSIFRLERNFSLTEGQTGRLSNGQLEITLNDADSRDDEARITLGFACRQGTNCFYYPSRSVTLEEGEDVEFQDYNIELVSVNSSSKATFRVEDVDDRDDDGDNDNDDATIEVTDPDSGDTYEQGDELTIVWESDNEPSEAEVKLELYTSGGTRVGLIAYSNDTDDNFDWNIPVPDTFCTQQYPNGLCGYDLEGRFYIKASLVDNRDENNERVLDSDNSGTFEIED
jgi:peptidoglycan hydrolase-like protein with peptidoglycan-binding domain